MEAIPIPQFIDNPPQIMFWEADEIAPAFFLIGIGIITGTLTYCIVLAFGVHKLFVHFKSKHLRGYLLHVAYRIGMVPLNKKFPNGAIHFYHV